MRQLEITGVGKVEWRDAADPALGGDGEAIVRPLAVAMCDLDAGFLTGAVPLGDPFPLGHECVAEVVDVGDAVEGVAPGDVVVVPFQISCGDCDACRSGWTGSCLSVPRGSAYGMQPLGGDWGGALADRLRVPFADAMLVPLPDGLDPVAVASVADNVPDGFRAVSGPLAAAPGAEVLVVGGFARSVGLYAVASAVALGAGRVVYADPDSDQRSRAAALGAEPLEIEDEWPRRLGRFPIVVDASGSHDGLHAAIRSTAANGTCTSVAIYFEPERVTSAVVGFDDAPDALADPPTKLVLTP